MYISMQIFNFNYWNNLNLKKTVCYFHEKIYRLIYCVWIDGIWYENLTKVIFAIVSSITRGSVHGKKKDNRMLY